MYRLKMCAPSVVLALLSALFAGTGFASAAPCSGFPPMAVTYSAQTAGLGTMSYFDGSTGAEKVVRGATKVTVNLAGCAGARATVDGSAGVIIRIIPGATAFGQPICDSGLQDRSANCARSAYALRRVDN